MELDPKCIFVQKERNLDVHHPVIKLVASLARNRVVTFRFFLTFGGYVGLNTNLFLSNSKLALPYICRLIVFSLFTLFYRAIAPGQADRVFNGLVIP